MERNNSRIAILLLLASALTSFSAWLVWNTLSVETAFAAGERDLFQFWPYAVGVGVLVGCMLGTLCLWTSARPHRAAAIASGTALLLFAILSPVFVQPVEIAVLYAGSLVVCTALVVLSDVLSRRRLDVIQPIPRTGCLAPIRFYVFLASLVPVLAGMGIMSDSGFDGVRDVRNPRVVRAAHVASYALEFDKTGKTTPYWLRWEYAWKFADHSFSDRVLETFASEQERNSRVQKIEAMKQREETFPVHVSPVRPTDADRDYRPSSRQSVTGAFRGAAACAAITLLAILFNAQIAGLILQSVREYAKGFVPHMEKRCSACDASVPLSSQARQRCPHCNAYWRFMSTHYK